MSEPPDHDALFEQIVAGWTDEPAADDRDLAPLPAPLVAAEPAAYADDEGHYEPPPPPPAPRLAPETLWSVVAIVGGILTVFVLPLAGLLDRTRWTDRLGVLAIVGGLGLLVYRMRDTPHDGDDGAVL